MSILNDTTVVSQFSKLRPEDASFAWLQRVDLSQTYLSAITLYELRFGIEKMAIGARRSALSRWLSTELPVSFAGRILSVTPEIADDAGRLLAKVAAAGENVGSSDVLIAATARIHGFSIATLNTKHFRHLEVPLIRF